MGNEERAFWYDGNGNAAAFVIYDAAGMHPYYYFRNGQGDIIGLFDSNGNIVARYSYDSWGNLLSIKDGSGNNKTNDTAFIGYKNPLRYRGYYYDSETKLYYLQSRYYNPEWGRFLNADGIIGANGGLKANNIFIYCSNNPINAKDSTGFKVESLDLSINLSFFCGGAWTWSFVWDNHGSIATQFTPGVVVGSNAEITAGASYTCYDGYEKIQDMDKSTDTFSGGVGTAFIGGFAGVIDDSLPGDGTDHVVGYTVGVSAGIGTSVFGPVSGTMTTAKASDPNYVLKQGISQRTKQCVHRFSQPFHGADLPPCMVQIVCVNENCNYWVCYYATRADYR